MSMLHRLDELDVDSLFGCCVNLAIGAWVLAIVWVVFAGLFVEWEDVGYTVFEVYHDPGFAAIQAETWERQGDLIHFKNASGQVVSTCGTRTLKRIEKTTRKYSRIKRSKPEHSKDAYRNAVF